MKTINHLIHTAGLLTALLFLTACSSGGGDSGGAIDDRARRRVSRQAGEPGNRNQ